jgi:uncharacterized protein involved in exopolysaccharide biosynthesis
MPQVTDVDEIDLKELLAIFWRRRLVITAFAVIVAIAALGLALVLPKKYSASTLLIPVEGHSSGLGAGGSLLSRYQGLASMVGISVPGSEKAEESIALLKSTLITEKFLRQENLLPVLYSSRWNTAKKTWRHGAVAPTLWQASQYFKKKIRHVARDTKTGLVKLSIEWKNPKLAANWANALVRLTNNYAREKAIARARRDIAFLNSQATKTPYVEERQGIFSIMQAELTKEMLAKGSEEYALKVIDPAFAPEVPVFPRPLLWTVLALFLGAAIGCVYVLIRHQAAESRNSASQGTAAKGAMLEHAEKPISPRQSS